MTRWGFDRAELALFIRALNLMRGDIEYETRGRVKDPAKEKERVRIQHLVGKLKKEIKWRETA